MRKTKKCADHVVEAIASQMIMGIDRPPQKVVQGLAGMSSTGSFNTTLLNMKKKTGAVDYDSNTVWLTEKGKKMLPADAFRKPQTNDKMLKKLKEQVDGTKPKEIFDVLTDGKAYTRQELADKLQVQNNNSFGTYISKLSKVAERVDGKKKIRLPDVAFPCGRPCDRQKGEKDCEKTQAAIDL
jgi:hypothetical protein